MLIISNWVNIYGCTYERVIIPGLTFTTGVTDFLFFIPINTASRIFKD